MVTKPTTLGCPKGLVVGVDPSTASGGGSRTGCSVGKGPTSEEER